MNIIQMKNKDFIEKLEALTKKQAEERKEFNDGSKNCYYVDYEDFPEEGKPFQEWSNVTTYICNNQTGFSKVLKHYQLEVDYPYHNNNYPKKYPCRVTFEKSCLSICAPMYIEWEHISNWKYRNLASTAIEVNFETFEKEQLNDNN